MSERDAVREAGEQLAGSIAALCHEVAIRLASFASDGGVAGEPLQAAAYGRLAVLAERFDLDPTSTSIIGVAASASVDGRFPALFASLDPSRNRPRPRVDVAFALAGASLFDPVHRAAIQPDGVL